MMSRTFYGLALGLRRVSILSYRISEAPERALAAAVVGGLLIVCLVVWPPHWQGATTDNDDSGDV